MWQKRTIKKNKIFLKSIPILSVCEREKSHVIVGFDGPNMHKNSKLYTHFKRLLRQKMGV